MALYHEVSIGRTASAKEILDEDISYLQSVESSQDVEAKHYMNILPYTWEEFGKLLGGGQDLASEAEAAQASSEEGMTEALSPGTEAEAVQTFPEEEVTEAPVSGTEAEAVQTPSGEGVTEALSPGTEAGEAQTPPEAGMPIDDTTATAGKIAVAIEESTENGFVKRLSVDGNVYTGEEAMEKFALSSTNFYVEEIEGGIRFICLGKGNCLGISQYGANYMALNGSSVEDIVKYYYQDVSIVDYKK